MIAGIITTTLFQSSILQQKMANAYQAKIRAHAIASRQLTQIEKFLETSFDIPCSDNIEFIQFVPDTLHFNEKKGSNFYRINVKNQHEDGTHVHLSSTVAVRNYQPVLHWKFDQNISSLVAYELITINGQCQQSVVHQYDMATFPLNFDKSAVSVRVEKVVWQGKSSTILVGLIHSEIPTLFVLDISDPKARPLLLWQKVLPQGNIPHKPRIVYLANQTWAVVVLQNKTLLFNDLRDGYKIRNIPLNSLATKFSPLTVVDSKRRGHADAMYLGDSTGAMWKIHMDSPFSQDWFCSHSVVPGLGAIVDPIIVGRHPQGQGVLLYGLTQKKELYALWDDPHHPGQLPLYFIVKSPGKFTQPLLRQGYLIAATTEQQLTIMDAFSASVIREQKMSISKPELIDHTLFKDLLIVEKKPRSKLLTIIIPYQGKMGITECEVDYARLGRQTWQELH